MTLALLRLRQEDQQFRANGPHSNETLSKTKEEKYYVLLGK